MIGLSIVIAAVALVVFLALRDLRPCGVEYGTLVRCRALVGRRGHRFHLWERIPPEAPIRAWVEQDRLYWRNRAALMAEQRIGLSVMNPKAFVIGGVLW